MSSHLRVLRRVLAVALIITFIVSIVPPRVHAASYTVTNCNPSGAGSLRQAIVDANGHAGPDEITFNITCNRITLSSPIFPNITGDLTITGPGADSLTIDGAGQYRVFVITSGVNVTISGLTIQNAGNSGASPVRSSGGALTVQDTVFRDNKAGTGGAIYNNNGTLTVSNSAFINNKATYDSGAIHNYGMLSVSNSTFSGNSSSANGGAILHAGSGNTATITNSTFFGNFSGNGRGGGNAGAIYNAATLTLIHGTVSGNSTEVYGGGIYTIGTLYIRNSIVDGNSAQNGFNIHGSYIGTNNLIDTDPQLGPLQDNGGPTQTMMPLPGSPAIDRANAAYCPSTDQRGVARPVDGDGDGTPACDIGAVEAPGITPVRVQSITRGDPSPTNAANVGFTVTFDAAVTGVSAGNFALVAGGPSGASITGVSGSGTTWTVAANTGTGDGTLRLDMDNATGVSGPGDAPVANVPFATGEPYTIDKTAPTVSLSSLNADPTNTNISVTVTFSEGITGFDASDVVVGNGTISHFAGTGTSYTVVVVPGVDGLVSVDIPAGAAHDAAGNPTLAARLERTYDGTPPAVTVEQAAAQSDPTRTSPIVFTVTFSEDVTGFDASDVQLSGTAGATTAAVSGGPAVYTVEVSGMTADGTVSAALLAGAAVDRAGNHSAASTSTDNTVTYIDGNAPGVLVDPLALSVLEGGPAQPYTVRLASCPLAGEIVTVTIAPAAGVSTDRTTLTFDQTTWNTPQAVSVSAPDNAVADGSRISSIAHAVSSSDPSTPYGDGSVSAPPVAITIQDDDAPGIIIIETEGRTAVLPGGPADTYTVALAMQPAAGDTVTIALAYDSTRLDVTPTSLDFDDATWNTPQTVAVQAIHTGGSSPGAPTSPIVHTASSSSGSPYAGVTATVIVHLTSADPAPAGSTAADHARAQAPLCANLDGSTTDLVRADVPSDTVAQGSVFCRALVENGALRSGENLAEIGVPAVLARGVLQAVDVFGLDHSGHSVSHFTAPVRVCLRGDGALLYLDATTAPRQMRELVAVLAEGYTCATIPNAGTVVLVERGPASYPPADAPESPIVPGGCMVRTLRILNLRAAPDVSSEVLALVPYDVTLSVTGRQGEWFQVDYLGVRGWLSAAYVAPRGACEP